MLRFVPASAVLSLSALLGTFAACGAGDVNPPPHIDEADGAVQADSGAQEASAGTVTQSGKVVVLSANDPVVGATVKTSAGGGPVTTDAKGMYSLEVEANKPFSMQIEAPNFYSLLEQQTQASAPFNLGKTSLLSEATASFLLLTLRGYDSSMGVLSVAVERKATCADEAGATLAYTVDGNPPSGSSLYYFMGGAPNVSARAAESGAFPHAVLFNLPPGKPITVTVSHPTCKPSAFPVTKDLSADGLGSGNVTYVSPTLTTSAGKNTSFLRVFLE
jgi:hypothetical protein